MKKLIFVALCASLVVGCAGEPTPAPTTKVASWGAFCAAELSRCNGDFYIRNGLIEQIDTRIMTINEQRYLTGVLSSSELGTIESVIPADGDPDVYQDVALRYFRRGRV